MGCETSNPTVVAEAMSVKKDTAMSVEKTNQMSLKKNNKEAPKAASPPGTDILEEEKKIIERQWKVLSSDIKATGRAVFMHNLREQPETLMIKVYLCLECLVMWLILMPVIKV